jgi:acetyl esterase/lipase
MLRLRALNGWLRRVEKPFLKRATPEEMRRSFETKARVLFHPPKGTVKRPLSLENDGRMVPALSVTGPGAISDRILLYFHGGGYIFGSPETHSAMLARLSQLTGAVAILPNYSKAPEHPFPGAFSDARLAWNALVASGVSPRRIVVGGDSAGGGLALSLLGDLVASKGELPAGVFAFSPLTDLTFSGRSIQESAGSEVVLPGERLADMARFYLAGHDPTDPRVSPHFAEFPGAPPVWMGIGDREILRDDTRRMAQRLGAQGVRVDVEELPDVPHVWPIFRPMIPQADQTLRRLSGWITPLWDLPDES